MLGIGKGTVLEMSIKVHSVINQALIEPILSGRCCDRCPENEVGREKGVLSAGRL